MFNIQALGPLFAFFRIYNWILALTFFAKKLNENL